MSDKKVFLMILDGWGIGPYPERDAIAQANTPFFDYLMNNYPHSTLVTHGLNVGLPEGQMGNSEVGHLNIGAGRIVYQDLAKINLAVQDGTLAGNQALKEAVAFAALHNKPVHLLGLVSDGGVHSHINHFEALVDIIHDLGVSDLFIHAFTDGRDTDPKSGLGFIDRLGDHIKGKAQIASLIGRYYAMDRDHRWERVQKAYNLLVHGTGNAVTDLHEAILNSYSHGITDEFIEPLVHVDTMGQPIATIKDGDVVICVNFRTDRLRELTEVLTQHDVSEQSMKPLNDLYYVTMTRYDEHFKGIHILFSKDDLSNTIGEVLSKNGKTQLRIAETEKYPHVTFFFSGGREDAFDGESRVMIASPKVATYDLQPEMSAMGIKDAVIQQIKHQKPDFICLNFANTDMVGHTGVFQAAVKAAETVDHCMSEIIPQGLAEGYDFIVIADHGNSDYMINDDGTPNTAHTKNPVPVIYVTRDVENKQIKGGKLADIAPTILTILGVTLPAEMTGDILLT